MSIDEENKKNKEMEVKIQNQIDNNIDLVSSEQIIVNNIDSSLSKDNSKNKNQITFNNINVLNNSKNNNSELIYGAPYEIKYPKKIGNLIAFLYLKNTPLIVLSKDCKYAPLILNIN